MKTTAVSAYEAENHKIRTRATLMQGFLHEQLITFESKFESNEEEFTAEQMSNYLRASKYLSRLGRNDNGYIERIQNQLNKLPY